VVPSSSACISLLLYGGFIIDIRRHNFVLLFSLKKFENVSKDWPQLMNN
jgi:hypothetical protein